VKKSNQGTVWGQKKRRVQVTLYKGTKNFFKTGLTQKQGRNTTGKNPPEGIVKRRGNSVKTYHRKNRKKERKKFRRPEIMMTKSKEKKKE